mmetsp:Transcript_19274/g.29247  ORF Transcript_19274/g.29247 Transcript_19274/m.29247 type:complete len:387 (+) Transcript_19274:47-1207(+)
MTQLLLFLGLAIGMKMPMEMNAQSQRRRQVTSGLLSTLLLMPNSEANAASGGVSVGSRGKIYGIDEDEPFRAALEQIGSLLDRLGVEGAMNKEREESIGPTIERSYSVGVRKGSDRLQACPEDRPCLSSTRAENKNRLTSPYVYFDQKGDAVGRLLELLYTSKDAQLLAAKGNFFTGAGVFVLAEIIDKDMTHDVEFAFLPGILESIIDVRIVQRDGPRLSEKDSMNRQRALLSAFADKLQWIPLDLGENDINLNSTQIEVLTASRTEMKFRDRFEEDMEKADQELEQVMDKERQRIDELKKEVRALLDALSSQEDARLNEYLELRSKTLATREEYEAGVAKRIGGYTNTGRYGGSQSTRLSNSFSGLINSQDDTLSKIYQQSGGS